jgi:hypothetical protein
MDDLLATIQSANPNAPAAPAAAPVAAAPTPQVSAAFDPMKSYGTPGKLLDNLQSEESSGNPLAVNKTTQAMGPYQFTPSTVAALRQQGVKFDPFDPVQARNAADYYLQQLKGQNGGTYQGALKAYGGFKNADPTQYIAKAMNGVPAAPTTPGQSNSGAPAPADNGPMSDLFSTLQQGAPKPAQIPAAPAAPTSPQQPQVGALKQFGQASAGLADTLLSAPGAAAGAADYAVRRAFQQSPEEAQAASGRDFGGAVHPVGNAFGVTNTPGYQNEASQRLQQAVGGVVGKGVNAVAGATGAAPQDVANMAGSLSMLVPSMAHVATGIAAPIVRDAAGGLSEAAEAGAQPAAGVSGRASIGAAGTSFAQQATAEGVPDAITARIAAAEKAGTLNPTAAGRHIEAGSLPVPVELTAGQASGDVQMLSNEMNSRAKNPELAQRFNAQNGQLAENLNVLRDQVSPNVNVPSGAPTGQALVDAYKQMDAPITQQISELYGKARGAEGAPALVDAATPMKEFADQVGPTRFNALPANVQQIFRDASANQVSLPAGFEQGGSNVRPMNVSDLMDIDKTLSGAMRGATDGSVRHDIGALRDSIVNSNLDPSTAGSDAFAAYKTAQASARARFQAMDADPAYKAAVNDSAAPGEPSPLADDFVRKYIAGGKTSNVQNMMQNLSTDPVNQELVASGLMDHIRAQAGIDLRTGSGNISQAGLNKAIQNLGDKTRIVLGPDASQTVEKLGNVARYTQEQPRGSFVNNSNTFVAHAGNVAKSVVERGINTAIPGAGLGTWGREVLANRANTKSVARSLEPGAGLSAVPLNQLLKNAKGNP